MPRDDQALWAAIHAERASLADDLAGLSEEQWHAPSLSGAWTVQDVVAHLTAAASVGRVRWLRSIVGARFRADVHNQRRMLEHRGRTPAETLDRFRAVVGSTTAASGHTAAWLGEVVVHAQDIRRPLGLTTTPALTAVAPVADFYAARDFAVASRTAMKGLRLEAVDSDFAAGDGPLVRGTTLALVMMMAGRHAYGEDLTGPGAETLRARAREAAAADR